ncbi:MAG: protein NO VEIN domain-containing protein [Coriobacteriia bacterium]
MAGDWSSQEVEAAVADYFAMLALELRGASYNKSEHRRALREILDGRSDGSVERKHSNISAVLVELGFPYLRGYKPLHNYQRALVEAVGQRLAQSEDLERIVEAAVAEHAAVPVLGDLSALLVEAPHRGAAASIVAREAAAQWRVRRKVDYLAREARNVSLGRAGEEFVMNFETARLRSAGREALADRVEHVALTVGDGLGFDVRSFDLEGHETLIEVKTTN